MRSIWNLLRYPVYILLAYLAGVLLYATLSDWRAPEADLLADDSPGGHGVIDTTVVSFVTWNVGGGALGAGDAGYLDHGNIFWAGTDGVRPSSERVTDYVAGLRLTVGTTASDFFLLQEVDRGSRRSYFTDQVDTLRGARPDYAARYATDHRSPRIPLPLLQPWNAYGAVESGLLSLSRFTPSMTISLALPGAERWPARLYGPDYSLLRQNFPTRWGKDLVLFTIRLAPGGPTGGLSREQMVFVHHQMMDAEREGHYVVVAGDWAQLPPGFSWFILNPTVEETQLPPTMPFDFVPEDWTVAYDPQTATVRATDAPYSDHTSIRSLTDYFICSPDVRLREIKTLNQDFRFSDHQPVYLEAELLR